MRVCHTLEPVFDDPNLIAFGGLPAVMTLAERVGLHDLVDEHVTVPGPAGANASVKVSAIIAGMVAGADSFSDLDVLRHGGMGRVFTGLRAATTLGTHLRGYRFGHVRLYRPGFSRGSRLLRVRVSSPVVVDRRTLPRIRRVAGIRSRRGAVGGCTSRGTRRPRTRDR